MYTTQRAHAYVLGVISNLGRTGFDVKVSEVKGNDDNPALPGASFKKAKFTGLNAKELKEVETFYAEMRMKGIFFPAKFAKTTAEFDLGAKFELYNDPKLRDFLAVDAKDVYAKVNVDIKSKDKKNATTAKVPKKIRVVHTVCEFADKLVVTVDRAGNPIAHLCGVKSRKLTAAIKENTLGKLNVEKIKF